MRGLLRRLHRWLGLIGGGFLALIGLSGSVLVYEAELDAWLAPAFHTPLADVAPGQAPALQTVLEAARRRWPGMESALLGLPADPRQPLRLYFSEGGASREAALHPQSGAWLAERGDDHLLAWISALHVQLLAGRPGFLLVGVLGFGLLLAALSGLWLSWPRKGNWRVVLTWKRGAHGVRRQFDQHRTAGLYPWAVLMVLGFSGAYLVFPQPFQALLRPLAPVAAFPSGLSSAPAAGRPPLSLEAAVALAHRHYPQARITFINPAFAETDFIRIRLRQPGEWLHRGQTRLWLDRYSGAVLARTDPRAANRAERFLAAQLPLHLGEVLGEPGRLLWALAGLAPAWLLVSGLRIWWHSARRRPWRQRRRQTAP
ncbi:MAG TPA: PepSY-associated TM helix domain-containing protein [Nevskiaceae bacterium]|nr:PepSY-associated TM helix domain-containing protein [Nevskiaceae bacterium]